LVWHWDVVGNLGTHCLGLGGKIIPVVCKKSLQRSKSHRAALQQLSKPYSFGMVGTDGGCGRLRGPASSGSGSGSIKSSSNNSGSGSSAAAVAASRAEAAASRAA
jgi:hypothetical protein